MSTFVDAGELTNYIGKDLGHSSWLKIDQERINDFADATLDHQFIHVDVEKAKETPFGTTIAHGYLTLSLLPHLASEVSLVPNNIVMGINYGSNKLRFLQPVPVGSEVRAHVVVKDVVEKSPGQFLITNETTVEIKGQDKPALIVENLTMFVVG